MNITEPLIYSAVSPATLLSRGWNLLRYHLKPSILLMMIPAFLGVIGSFLFLIPSAFPVMTQNNPVGAFFFMFLLGMGVVGLSVIVRLLCMSILSRMYYRTLMKGVPTPFWEAFKGALKSKQAFFALLVLFLAVSVLAIGFFILDMFLFGFSMLAIYIFGALLVVAFVIPNFIFQFLFAIIAIVLFIIGGGLVALSLVSIITIQAALCLFPIVGAANTNKTGFLEVIESGLQSLRLLRTNLFRTLVFGFLLFVLYTVLSLAMTLPLQTWFILEVIFNRPDDLTLVPIHKSLMMSIYQALTFSILWPYIFAAITLFWYDCRVRSEGLDLRLMLHQMNERFKSRTRVIKEKTVKK